MDIQKFLNAAFTPREKAVDVPELAEFFGDAAPVWTVRGLTAAELWQCVDVGNNVLRKVQQALDKALGAPDGCDADLRAAATQTPAEISKRIEMLAIGSVSPAIGDDNREVAVKLSEINSEVFFKLTNIIKDLTGEGSERGKPKRSGQAAK